MQIEILTIFPEYFRTPLQESLLGKALSAGLLEVEITDLRDFALDRHRKVDDEPFGGGAGMIMTAPVVTAAIEGRRDAAGRPRAWTVLMGPEGRRLDQAAAAALALRPRILLVCGRYEGIDERVRQLGLYDEEISLGDFVLPGGEAAALALTETVSRLIPGVVGTPESLEEESFQGDRLDYPHYTRPREFRGLSAPDVLVSGDHRKILRWRRAAALARTRERRPDLLARRPPEPGEDGE
ncbi:MAG TPA: tRNA (guanosine(37)-N1)-methyltransferase TrmD [Thermoanaerobaculia bacterium]|jgi:tRNA (guanine37-N1)-methyltransferase